jgi:hypothetical protein
MCAGGGLTQFIAVRTPRGTCDVETMAVEDAGSIHVLSVKGETPPPVGVGRHGARCQLEHEGHGMIPGAAFAIELVDGGDQRLVLRGRARAQNAAAEEVQGPVVPTPCNRTLPDARSGPPRRAHLPGRLRARPSSSTRA